jgi:hypothetical protein
MKGRGGLVTGATCICYRPLGMNTRGTCMQASLCGKPSILKGFESEVTKIVWQGSTGLAAWLRSTSGA